MVGQVPFSHPLISPRSGYEKTWFFGRVVADPVFPFLDPVPAAAAKGEPAKLSVRGNAVLSVPADRLNLDIGVIATAQKADDALRAANRKLNDVSKALEKAGSRKRNTRPAVSNFVPNGHPGPKTLTVSGAPRLSGSLFPPACPSRR